MIKLNLPDSTEIYWINIQGALIGPYGTTGLTQGNLVERRSGLDYLSEARGIFRENFVDNVQVSGYLTYIPILGSVTDSPSTRYPTHITYHSFSNGKVLGNYGFNGGIVYDGLCYPEFNSTYVYNYAFTLINQYDFFVVRTMAYKSSPSVVVLLNKYEYKYSRTDSSAGIVYTTLRSTSRNLGNGLKVGFDATVRLTREQVNSLLGGTWSVGSWGTPAPSTAYTHTVPYEANLSLLFSGVDVLVSNVLNPVPYPIPDRHYGDLAMEASQKTNANSVNMIAFFRDLRHPTEMIPKLRNLAKLKVLSHNYLTVKYGILPTIDDLNTILGAFKRIAPYLDSNGFETYSAGHTVESTVGSYTYKLEQHIKLAIENEDDQFQALVGKLDSIGGLLTLQNAWDLIPYSFVLDWFIDVGGFLERVDSMLRIIRLNIRYATMSRRTEVSTSLIPTVQYPYAGSVSQAHYQRWVSDQCPVPPASIETTFQDFNHWLESTALLVQRSKTRR